jgi:hypothetical protein
MGSRGGNRDYNDSLTPSLPISLSPSLGPLGPAKLTAYIDHWPQITLNSNHGSCSSRGRQTFSSQIQEERSSRYLWHAARSFRHPSKAKVILQSFDPTVETITKAVTKARERTYTRAFAPRGIIHGLYPRFICPQWLEVRRNEV